jgi:hypothetical protein
VRDRPARRAPRLMRTDSSPSLISISPMPDSSSSSISFLTLRISMAISQQWLGRESLSGAERMLQRVFVALGTEAADYASARSEK